MTWISHSETELRLAAETSVALVWHVLGTVAAKENKSGPNAILNLILGIGVYAVLPFLSITQLQQTDSANTRQDHDLKAAKKELSIFDGQSLAGWKITNFGGEGECRAENGSLIIEAGYPMSGVTCTRKDLPKTSYTLTLEAMKAQGEDFFCGVTFPVNDSHCTFIAGGWGGVVTGLSCIDDQDANNNETKKLKNYKNDRWYKIRIHVEPERIQVWVDQEKLIDQNIKGRKISVRNETRKCRPMGICNFQTTSHFRNIRIKTRSNSQN